MRPSLRPHIILAGLLGSALLFAAPPAANAGLILQAPTYVGLNSGLVGSWTFDAKDLAGVTAYDRSGQGNNGTLTGGPARAAGKIGQALSFDTSNRVELSGPQNLSTSTWAVSFWIKHNSFSNWQAPFGAITTSFADARIKFEINAGGTLTFFDVFNMRVDSSVPLALNRWYFIVATYDHPNQKARLYVDGSFDGEDTLFDMQPSSSIGRLTIGAEPTDLVGNINYAFDGLIDDVRIYNRALTPAEIKRLYKIGGTQTLKAPNNLGLIGYWRIDEGSGTLAADSSISRNDGTLVSGPTWVNGRVNKALSFDGVDDFVKIMDPFNPTAYTISAWIRPRSPSAASIYLRTSAIGPTGNWSHQLRINSSGIFEHYTYSDDIGARSVPGSTTLIPDQWYFVVGTAVNSGNMRLYVNGSEEGTATVIGTLWIGGDRYHIGSNSGDGMGWFSGDADEVRIYNRALSAEEIRNLYESSKQVLVNSSQNNQLTDGLVGLWSFDGQDMAGVTAYDRSGQGNNGTLTGGPARAAGKLGQALSFDGSNDCIDVPTLNWPVVSDVTVSFWNFVASASVGDSSAFGVGLVGDPDRFQAHVPWQDRILYWDYDTDGRIFTDYSAYLDKWTHVSLVSGAAFKGIYLDGVLVVSSTNAESPDEPLSFLMIGCGIPNAGSRRYQSGKIDDFRVYNRALSADEIKRLYNMGR